MRTPGAGSRGDGQHTDQETNCRDSPLAHATSRLIKLVKVPNSIGHYSRAFGAVK
jgi:hypothetical protein